MDRQHAPAGAGLALLPVFMADADPRLTRVQPPDPTLVSSENLIVHRDLLREPAIRRTVDALAALYRQARPRLLGQIDGETGVAA